MNRQLTRSFLVALLISLTLVIVRNSASASSLKNEPESTKETALHDAMRKLWEDHIIWTPVFIISAAADLPDKAAATDRLLQNQVDIGNAIKPYYGDAAGNQLTVLLKEHITTAAEIVAAAKAGDKASRMMLRNAGLPTPIKSRIS
jgi:type IV secretory pathway VirJ component